MEETEVVVDEEIQKANNDIVTKVNDLIVNDQASCDMALDLKKVCIDLEKKTIAYFKKLKEPAQITLDAIRKAEKAELEPITATKRLAATKLTEYSNRLETERLAEEKRQREEAEKKQAAEVARLKEEALKAADSGEEAEFEEKLFQAEHSTVEDHMPVSTPSPKVKGIKVVWYAEVTDMRLLLKEILEKRVAIDAVEINSKWKRDIAGANTDQITIPGLTIKSKKVI